MYIGKAALEIARREIGASEFPPGTNRGPKPYMPGWAWCATFGTWCLVKAGWKEIGKRPFNTDYCPSWEKVSRDTHTLGLYQTVSPIPGDVVLYDWQNDEVADHFGFFDRWAVRGQTFYAIEGNTSTWNQSNGGQVMHRLRHVGDVDCFIRLPYVKLTLSERLRVSGYGTKTIPVILRRLKEGHKGTVPNPGDSRMFRNLRQLGGLGADSARAVIKALRRK